MPEETPCILVKQAVHYAAMNLDTAQSRSSAAHPGLRLGERLRQLRVAAGFTQSELAGDRFSKEYVSQI